MKKLRIITIIFLVLGCNNGTLEERKEPTDTPKKDTIRQRALMRTLNTPFTYACDDKLDFGFIPASDVGFNHVRNAGMSLAGEIFFDSKCKEMHYYLFFGIGDVMIPYIDVYENDIYKDRINIYEDNHGCGYDAGYGKSETTVFQSNGKVITISKEETYQLDTVNYNPIDSTRKNIYDTLILDLKDWCMR